MRSDERPPLSSDPPVGHIFMLAWWCSSHYRCNVTFSPPWAQTPPFVRFHIPLISQPPPGVHRTGAHHLCPCFQSNTKQVVRLSLAGHGILSGDVCSRARGEGMLILCWRLPQHSLSAEAFRVTAPALSQCRGYNSPKPLNPGEPWGPSTTGVGLTGHKV